MLGRAVFIVATRDVPALSAWRQIASFLPISANSSSVPAYDSIVLHRATLWVSEERLTMLEQRLKAALMLCPTLPELRRDVGETKPLWLMADDHDDG